jgi:hypothetical protein
MRTLIEKEIRLLLPAFVGALVLAILPIWLLPHDDYNPAYDFWNLGLFPTCFFLFGIVLLGLSSYGREIGLRTLPFILAQPMERVRIWWTKVAVLGLFVALVFDAWWLSGSLCSIHRPAALVPPMDLAVIGLFEAVFIAGGLWMTLLLRQTVAAFWLTVLIPMAMVSAIELIGGADWMIFASLGVYAVAGFFLARWQFLHMQDTAWTGGVISFGRARAVGEQVALREHRPWAALLRKELQLQQVTLIGMGCLLVLHLGVVFLRKAGAHVLGGTTLAILEMFGLLWFIVPMVAGSLSVADERQLGMLDGLLCLPVSRRVQFVFKLLFALALGLMSAAAFCAMDWVASAMGAGKNLSAMEIDSLVSVFLALALLGFYASTLTRGMVPALAAGVVASAALYLIGSSVPRCTGFPLWYRMAIPTLTAGFIWLAYGNFRHVLESGRRWRRNIVVLTSLIVLVTASASAVYHRVWEWAMPLEDAHGPARLAAGKRALLRSGFSSGLAVVLPDGRLWVDRTDLDDRRLRRGGQYFASGSNWVDAFENVCETVGIRSDGTLWVSEKPQWGAEDPLPPLVQFGAETGWQSLASANFSAVVLLKRDGTLWYWGTNCFNDGTFWIRANNHFGSKTYKGLRTFVPFRLGAESDWARILQGELSPYAWKRDGHAWALCDFEPNAERRRVGIEFGQGTVAERVPQVDDVQFRSLSSSETSLPIEVGVREDGTLWYWNWWAAEHAKPGSASNGAAAPGLVQIGKDSNWAAVAGGFWSLMALKTDGSIWQWSLVRENRGAGPEALQVPPERLGTHHDWIGLGYWRDDRVFLSADGTMWSWPDSGLPARWSYGLLAPSRRPAKIENIFGVPE